MITSDEAIELLRSNDLIGLAMEADAVRKRLHPECIVSYPAREVLLPEPSETISLSPGESMEEYVTRLALLRQQQEATGAVTAVIPRAHGTAAEYLKIVAVSRIYLENISHVQTSWVVGLKICQIALRFGADDITGSQNEKHRPTEEQLRCLIRDAGFVPKQRDALFQSYFLD